MTREAAMSQRTGYPNYLSEVEVRIMSEILDRIIADPQLYVVISDEDDFDERQPTRSRQEIEENSGVSDTTTWLIFREKRYIGSLLFVHGNEEDVLSDYAWLIRPENTSGQIRKLVTGE